MKFFVTGNKHFLLLVLIFLVAELIVNPAGNFPLNDDWTYSKSVLIYQNEGRIDIGDFPAMTLYSHIIWGALFTKLFWFSFNILRLSTLISSFIGITVLYHLVLRISKNKQLSFFAGLLLLLNPIYFNLSNTFMTDVNFNTVLLLCCWFAYDFFLTKKLSSFLLVFALSVALILIRQFGLIVPVSFLFCCIFIKEKRFFYTGLSLLLTVGVYAVLKYYEAHLKSYLDPSSAYKFSSDTHVMSAVFWDKLNVNFKLRFGQIVLHILLYSAPFSLIFLFQLLRKVHFLVSISVFSFSAALVHYVFKEVSFPVGNIFTNMALGAETFFETLYPQLQSAHEHTYSPGFAQLTTLIKYVFCTISLGAFTLFIFLGFQKKTFAMNANPAFIFLCLLAGTYIFMILITESYYDRYHLPLITLSLLFFVFWPDTSQLNYVGTVVILVMMFYVSVFGTKDYFELNRKRWEAYSFLKNTMKIDPVKINGGFEVNCWNEGKRSWWYQFLSLSDYDHLIQYRKEAGFSVNKVYEFQRFFPFKKDTIFIFSRENLLPEKDL